MAQSKLAVPTVQLHYCNAQLVALEEKIFLVCN